MTNGSVSLNGAGTQLTFTPTANYNGAASFTYTVTSGGVTGNRDGQHYRHGGQ
ncbi:MAG: cadherin-like domain-containing protein [Rhodocyclaceae bacterium]|nr:cadherin-like domain-containing protein [Rhodocyclaceae bacterium]